MRVPLVRQGMLMGLCGLVVSSCSYPHAGPELPPGATSAQDVSPLPPPVLVTQKSVPAASPTYPTGHPSLRPSTSYTKPVATTATASSSAASASSPVSTASARSSGTNPIAPNPAPAAPANSLEAAVPTATLPMATPVSDQESAAPTTDIGSSFDNLDITDDSLKGKLAILRVGSEPSANNLLSVFAGLKNRTSQPLALQVQTIYKDKDGNSLNAGSWIPMTLKPHEQTEYRSTSISAQAVDFLVRVRRAPEEGATEAN